MAIELKDALKNLPVKDEAESNDHRFIQDSGDVLHKNPVQVNPTGMVFVDGRYAANQTPYFDNIESAITGARAMIQNGLTRVVIRAFLTTDGGPIDLGGNDYYELFNEGIIFESTFDLWPQFVLFGIDLNNDDLSYTINNARLPLELFNHDISELLTTPTDPPGYYEYYGEFMGIGLQLLEG